jgi:hypothetical protein
MSTFVTKVNYGGKRFSPATCIKSMMFSVCAAFDSEYAYINALLLEYEYSFSHWSYGTGTLVLKYQRKMREVLAFYWIGGVVFSFRYYKIKCNTVSRHFYFNDCMAECTMTGGKFKPVYDVLYSNVSARDSPNYLKFEDLLRISK